MELTLLHKQEFPAGICPVKSDITYEELTLSAIISLKYYITNLSDITYEELTLSSSFLIVDSLIFSRTLPMRN